MGNGYMPLERPILRLQVLAKAPNNTANFFGLGNETEYDKTGDYKTYYRTRYSTYQVDPALRFRKNTRSSFSIGPSLYFYVFDKEENKGRFINNVDEIGSYDSATIEKEKWHLGIVANYTRDKRSNAVFPQWGTFINVRLQAYHGIGAVCEIICPVDAGTGAIQRPESQVNNRDC